MYGLQQLVAATYALGSTVQIDYFGSGNAASTERAAIYLSALLHLYSGITNIYVAGTDGVPLCLWCCLTVENAIHSHSQ